jgi:hypothetical protein
MFGIDPLLTLLIMVGAFARLLVWVSAFALGFFVVGPFLARFVT